MDVVVIALLVLAIALVSVLTAALAMRRERGQPRGQAPGTGDHIIQVEYSSGLGGGHFGEIRVPRDPQIYAQRFVPRTASRAPRTTPEPPVDTKDSPDDHHR